MKTYAVVDTYGGQSTLKVFATYEAAEAFLRELHNSIRYTIEERNGCWTPYGN